MRSAGRFPLLTGLEPGGNLAAEPLLPMSFLISPAGPPARGDVVRSPHWRWHMDTLVALGLSIGILIAIWTYLALGVAALPVWAGIVAWGSFFAAGGKTSGLVKTIAANLSGVFWAFLALKAAQQLGGGTTTLAILVGVAALLMVLQAKISLLSFIPGAFLGAATAVSVVVGANGSWTKTIVALVAGAIFGYLSELIAGAMTRKQVAA
jgi:hypothetical protein